MLSGKRLYSGPAKADCGVELIRVLKPDKSGFQRLIYFPMQAKWTKEEEKIRIRTTTTIAAAITVIIITAITTTKAPIITITTEE